MARKRIKRPKSKGLGDSIEAITEKTGIKKVVKAVFGESCGCDERKKILNDIFPYRKVNCLEEEEYKFLDSFYNKKSKVITNEEQVEFLKISNRIFKRNNKKTSCAACVRSMVNELKQVYLAYNN